MMNKKIKWLLNFSSSPAGGSLKRLIATAKWFDKQEGAYFIVHDKAYNKVKSFSQNNQYFIIKQSRFKRLLADGYYLPGIIAQIGKPDVYFSYGIPLFDNIGKVNWLHINNALTLTTNKIKISLFLLYKLKLLGKRILKSMDKVQIATAESKFSLSLLKNNKLNTNKHCFYTILPNGCEKDFIKAGKNKAIINHIVKYAVTVGTFTYKRLDKALAVFYYLQEEDPQLEKIKIIGDIKTIPKKVLQDNHVEALGKVSDKFFFNILHSAEYYISTSQIENSSIAALEGLTLSKNTVLSDIPSHYELVENLDKQYIFNNNHEKYIKISKQKNINKISSVSWEDVCKKMHQILGNYKAKIKF